jgi:hypothetical protein
MTVIRNVIREVFGTTEMINFVSNQRRLIAEWSYRAVIAVLLSVIAYRLCTDVEVRGYVSADVGSVYVSSIGETVDVRVANR